MVEKTKCKNQECNLYPYYGVAPHKCFYKLGKDKTIGESELIPSNKWPKNFVVEVEDGETEESAKYPSACGVYYCPDCLNGKPKKS